MNNTHGYIKFSIVGSIMVYMDMAQIFLIFYELTHR